jgi:hypothetical protein
VVAHAKYVTFQLADVAIPWQLFAQILASSGSPACALPVPHVEIIHPKNRVRKPSPGVRSVPGRRISGAQRRKSVSRGRLRPQWGGSRQRF